MCGSTMGVWSGLSFYTSAAQPATPPIPASLSNIHTGEIKIGGRRNVNLRRESKKYVLNFCTATMHQVLNGGEVVIRAWVG